MRLIFSAEDGCDFGGNPTQDLVRQIDNHPLSHHIGFFTKYSRTTHLFFSMTHQRGAGTLLKSLPLVKGTKTR